LNIGKESEFLWSGDLDFLQKEQVVLPVPDWNDRKENSKFIVELSRPNGVKDENPFNNELISEVKAPLILPKDFVIKIKTNNLGRSKENSYTISNSLGTILYHIESFEDSTEYEIPIYLDEGCYQFRFKDHMEDGISVHWWYRKSDPDMVGINGDVSLVSLDGKILHQFKADFGQELLLNFIVSEK